VLISVICPLIKFVTGKKSSVFKGEACSTTLSGACWVCEHEMNRVVKIIARKWFLIVSKLVGKLQMGEE
jgi:hypothetical protein